MAVVGVILSEAVGGLVKFFLDRFGRAIDELESNPKEFRRSIAGWVEGQAKEDSKIKHYLPKITDTIIELMDMRLTLKGVQKASSPEAVIGFFEKYCRNWLFLDEVGATYLRVTENWHITTDYMDQLQVKLFDVYSDLALTGSICLEQIEELIDEDKVGEGLVYKSFVLGRSLQDFLKKAAEVAGKRDKYKTEHLNYIQRVSVSVDVCVGILCWKLGDILLQQGNFKGAMSLYNLATKTYKELAEREKAPEARKELEIFSGTSLALVQKALALAWFEKCSLTTCEVSNLLPKPSLFRKTKEAFGIDLNGLRNALEEERKRIEELGTLFDAEFDEVAENLPTPLIESPEAVLALPGLNLTPPPPD